MVIRILTEDKNSERLRDLTAKRFDSFTMIRGMGQWKGQQEPCVVIEIAVFPGDSITRCKLMSTLLAEDIKKANRQEAVLIEYIDANNVLI
jgi:hypothetical protein